MKSLSPARIQCAGFPFCAGLHSYAKNKQGVIKRYWFSLQGMDPELFKQGLLTRFDIPASPSIGINDPIFFIGSCFSENIGSRFSQLGFFTQINPFGILYNPVSIANAIEKITTDNHYSESDLFYYNTNFLSLDHHGSFHHRSAASLLTTINEGIQNSKNFLGNAHTAIITLGTSFVYILQSTEKIVANCHKIPGSEFRKILLSEGEIVESLEKCVLYLKKANPGIEIIFTISPVKHLRDGVLENATSKARLQSALASYLNTGRAIGCSYFPSYEIVTEELRDHRFYAEDLAHPSAWTTLYIFNRFANTKLNDRAKEFLEPALKYVRMKNHRIMTQNEDEIAKWEQAKKDYWEKLVAQFPDKKWPELFGDSVQ